MGESPARIFFRADCGRQIGLGHLSRCLNIADALRARGFKSFFLLDHGTARDFVAKRGHLPFVLASADQGPRQARETMNLARRLKPALLVTDSYRLKRGYYESLRESMPTLPVFAVDDLGEKADFPVQGVINVGLGANASRYAPALRARSVIGPEFFPLRAEFVGKFVKKRHPPRARRVILTMGGADPEGQTVRIVRILRGLPDLVHVDVILGPLYGSESRVFAAAEDDRKFHFHRAPRGLARLFSRADLAITGAGTTTNELAFLGVPMIALPLADNQALVAADIARRRCGAVLPRYNRVSDARIRSTIASLISDRKRREDYSSRARSCVDGRGAGRLAEFIAKFSKTYHVDRYSFTAVSKEYDKSSRFALEHEKVKWGSRQSMLNRMEVAAKRIGWRKVGAWLEIGVGTGAFLRLAERRADLRRFVGIDASEPLLSAARAQRYETKKKSFVRRSFMEDVPGAPFDLVTALGVLQKCGVPMPKAVARMAELLAPGGQLFITTKHRDWDRFRKTNSLPEPSHHWFSVGELTQAAECAGLRVVDVRGFDTADAKLCAPVDSHNVFLYAVKPR